MDSDNSDNSDNSESAAGHPDNVSEIDAVAVREPDHPVEPLFVRRWSPRSLSGESLDAEQLNSLFEAARWAPSSFNRQPWMFLYAERGDSEWQTFFDLMGDFNQKWAKDAAALMVVLSRNTTEDGDEIPTHSFDTGAAWQNLALQASELGLIAHGMAGFDYDRARTDLGVPEEYTVEAMIAVGKPGDPNDLPEKIAENESPNSRKPIEEISRRGGFS